ncbi:MAG: YkvA family protein [Candidatus Promineifilaceae bacterium]|nr:YkvA family protein [Candidatus Promineifilaceae bacterium]
MATGAAGEPLIERWKGWAHRLKQETHVLYVAYQDPRVPWYARLLALLVVAYAFSPIDLIPDPIPILGYLDDLLLVPAGIWLAVRMIPDEVVADARSEVGAAASAEKPLTLLGLALIGGLWVLAALLSVYFIVQVWETYV